MKTFIITTILTLLLFSITFNDSKALDTISVKYFPLQTGNKYTYKITFENSTLVHYSKAEIIKDTIINFNKFFYCNGFPATYDWNGWLRTDTATGNLYKFTEDNCPEWSSGYLVDSLGSNVNNAAGCPPYRSTCIQINNINLFGINSSEKVFRWQMQIIQGVEAHERRYVKNFGASGYVSIYAVGTFFSKTTYELKGCIINGVLYGDTSTTGVVQVSSIIPDQYVLYQNYPNPFNPETKIRYDVSSSENVSIKVFDVNGREVETLVNERQSPGTYEVTFNASTVTSGVYFYRLQSGEFYETKKMMIIK